jgi:hypothetical protein
MIRHSKMTPLLTALSGVPLVVIGLADWPIATLVFLVAIGRIQVRGRDRWALFRNAAIYGTIGEAICVLLPWTPSGAGLWIYAFPGPFGTALRLPIWLPLVWGALFVLYADLRDALLDLLPRSASERAIKRLRFLLVLPIVIYAGLLFRTIDIRILYVFTPFFTLFLLFWTRPRDLLLYYIAALLGSFGEILAMRFGLWAYTMPMWNNAMTDWIGVPGLPVSLAMAWGLSAVYVTAVSTRTVMASGK